MASGYCGGRLCYSGLNQTTGASEVMNTVLSTKPLVVQMPDQSPSQADDANGLAGYLDVDTRPHRRDFVTDEAQAGKE
jgi:hypothetical protein